MRGTEPGRSDLLTSPGRGPAEAEELINWMRANEEPWRR